MSAYDLFYGPTLDDHASRSYEEANGSVAPLLALVDAPEHREILDGQSGRSAEKSVYIALALSSEKEIETVVLINAEEEVLYAGEDLEEAANIAEIEATRLQGEGISIKAPNRRMALRKLEQMMKNS